MLENRDLDPCSSWPERCSGQPTRCLTLARQHKGIELFIFGQEAERSLFPAKLLTQTLQRVVFATDTKDGTVSLGTLFQYFAICVEFCTQLLCRPRKKEFGLDKILLEKSDDRPV